MKNTYLFLILISFYTHASELVHLEQSFIQGLENAYAKQVAYALDNGFPVNQYIYTHRYVPATKTLFKKTYTPLTYLLAAKENNEISMISVAAELLAKSSPTTSDLSGNHPLEMALNQKKLNLAELLLPHTLINFETSQGIQLFNASLEVKNNAFTKRLLTAYQGNWHQLSPLIIIAIKHNNSEIIAELLNKNINLNGVFFNLSPLEACIETNNTDLYRILVAHGALIEVDGLKGPALLIKTIRNNNFELTKLLLDAGANSQGLEEYALSHGYSALVELLLPNRNLSITDNGTRL
ncbi:MAG: ankyrin repeat domain-containing protein [Candidatus Dependentiae bacterium]